MMKTLRATARRAALGLVATAAAACSTPGAAGSQSDPIINGTQVPRGSLANLGVVRLSSGCSGTLLSNQYVMTAKHCVRALGPSGARAATRAAPAF